MAAVQFHCDESGKHHSSPYVSFCGFLGNGEQWAKLLPAWRAARIFHHTPPIHVSAMLHPSDKNGWLPLSQKYGSAWPAKCQELLDEFSLIIKGQKLLCVGAVIDVNAFKSLSLPILQARTTGDPHYLAFESAIVLAISNVLWGDSNATMGLIMDDDEEKAHHCYELYRMLRGHVAKAKERLSGICFANDDLYPGIQAADILAHESRRLMVDGASPSQRFRNLTHDLNQQPILLDAKRLQEWEAELQEEYDSGI
jgi:hypothetical protein